MIKFSFLVAATLFVFSFTSCKKYPGDINKHYKGVWSTDTVLALELGYNIHSFVIISEANSSAGILCNPDCISCGCLDFTEGKVRINKKETGMRVGDIGRTMFLKIDKTAYQETSGRWVMEIDSHKYYRR